MWQDNFFWVLMITGLVMLGGLALQLSAKPNSTAAHWGSNIVLIAFVVFVMRLLGIAS